MKEEKSQPHNSDPQKSPQPKPCRAFKRGYCKFGTHCRYSHQIIKCYLMRHAQSAFNEMLESFADEGNSEQAKLKFQFNEDFIDCGITEKGRQQIREVKFPQELLKTGTIRFDIIFVSPLERCLKTLDQSLMKHKIKTKKVIVLNQLTEVLSKICDIGHSIEHKKHKYQNFDFSYVVSQADQWQDELVGQEFKDKIEHKEKFGNRYLGLLKQIFPKPMENWSKCFKRSMKALQTMSQICLREKSTKILVVTHNRIIRNIMNRHNEEVVSKVGNCQINYTEI